MPGMRARIAEKPKEVLNLWCYECRAFNTYIGSHDAINMAAYEDGWRVKFRAGRSRKETRYFCGECRRKTR